MNENHKRYQQGLVMGILICLVIGLSAFIIYDKVLSKEEPNNNNNQQVENNNNDNNNNQQENNNTENEQNKEIAVTLTSKEQEELLNKIDSYNRMIEITNQYPIADINNLDNNVKLTFLSYHIGERADSSFTKDDLKEAANNYFYNGFSFTNGNIMCSIEEHTNLALYNYNNSTGTYTYNGGDNGLLHGHDGDFNQAKAYYLDGTYNESTKIYTFNVKVLYGEICGGTCGPISKFYDNSKLNNVVYQLGDKLEDFDEVYPKVKDKLPVTKYSFTKNSDGKFSLKSISY